MKTLGSEWRQYEKTFPNLQKSKIDMVSLEYRYSRVPMDLIELIRGKKVMVGAIDVATETIETPKWVVDTLRKALKFVDADKFKAATNCWMAILFRDVALARRSSKKNLRNKATGAPALNLPARSQPTRAPVQLGETYVRFWVTTQRR
jgi:methionine synthase II (cobalamin-independent)